MFESCTVVGTATNAGVFIPVADLSGLTAAESVTGDATRRLDYSISFFVEVPSSAYAMQSEPV
jgi:hypothetical protein